MKSSIRPLREEIPIYLAAEGPKNIAMAAELCEGWLALFYSPHHDDMYRDALSEGFGRDGARHGPEDFEVAATVPLIVTDDIEAAADALRPMYALYFGGMGARNTNFHANVGDPHGLRGRGGARSRTCTWNGHKEEAAAAVPTKLIEQLTLIGPADKIRHDLRALARVDRHHTAYRRRRRDDPHGRRDRPRLKAPACSGCALVQRRGVAWAGRARLADLV